MERPYLKTSEIKAETANEESLKDNKFSVFNLYTGLATGQAIGVFIVLGTGYCLIRCLSKRKLLKAPRTGR